MAKEDALKIVEDFRVRTSPSRFPKLDRAIVAAQLKDRVDNAFNIDQGTAGICGPASVTFEIAQKKPEQYASAVAGLFEKGEANIGKWKIKPCADLFAAACPNGVAQADWIMLASIRDSENWFYDYVTDQNDESSGATSTDEIEKWMKKAGFTDIKTDFIATHLFNREPVLKTALDLYQKEYQVTWFINASIFSSSFSDDANMNHFVVMAGDWSPPASKDAAVSIPVFSWGKKTTIPQSGGLKYGQFLENYFGYCAGKL